MSDGQNGWTLDIDKSENENISNAADVLRGNIGFQFSIVYVFYLPDIVNFIIFINCLKKTFRYTFRIVCSELQCFRELLIYFWPVHWKYLN